MRRIRIRPHHLAIGVGVVLFVSLIASDAVASILKWHDHSPIQPDFNFVGNGLPDNIGREAIFYCQLLDSREVTLVARDDDPARVTKALR